MNILKSFSQNRKCINDSLFVGNPYIFYIEETGVVVENPVIGHIPSRQEIVNELEELLMTM